jgi:hypothetical protein
LHSVTIQEIDGRTLLHDHDMRAEHQSLLIHDRVFLRSRKCLTRDGVDKLVVCIPLAMEVFPPNRIRVIPSRTH